MVDPVTIAVDDGLLESERAGEELDECPGIASPSVGQTCGGGVFCVMLPSLPLVARPRLGNFGTPAATQVVGADPAIALKSRSRCAWS